MHFLYGFLGALLVVALLLSGALCGWTAHKTYLRVTGSPPAERPGEVERKRLEEQQEAFHMLQNYSAERAYGLMTDAELLQHRKGGDEV